MIKAVFFDLGWTLVKPTSGDWLFTMEFQKHFKDLKVSHDVFQSAYKPLAENPYMKDEDEQIQRFTTFYKDILDGMQTEYDHDLPCHIAYDLTKNDENMLLIETAEETLNILKQNNIYLGIISDTWPYINHQLEYLNILKYFDNVTYSYSLGTNKPSPMMYQDALQKAGFLPRECLFIDDIGRNLEAAERFHINALQSVYNPDCVIDERFPPVKKPIEILEYLRKEAV